MQPGTGNVLAMAVNKPYGTGPPRPDHDPDADAPPRCSPGSTFKAITLTAALSQGLPLSTSFYSPACYVSPIYHFGDGTTTESPRARLRNGVSNADPTPNPARTTWSHGTWNSVNTYYVQLEEKVGLENVPTWRCGSASPPSVSADLGANSGSLTIGGYAVSPLDMATAYATLAARGLRCPSHGAAVGHQPRRQARRADPARRLPAGHPPVRRRHR